MPDDAFYDSNIVHIVPPERDQHRIKMVRVEVEGVPAHYLRSHLKKINKERLEFQPTSSVKERES